MDRRDQRAFCHQASAPARALQRLAALLAALPLAAAATIELPDHVIYGSASVFGNPALNGTVVQARAVPGGEVLASYVIGRNPRLGGQFALAIPMDAVDPRTPGRARPGDPLELWVGAQLGGQTTVGAEGVAVRLDIDPQNLGTGPALSVASAQLAEGNSGLRTLSFPVTINTTSNVAVNVDWETVDGSATGGLACGDGIDYVHDQGTAAIAAGAQSTSIGVMLCGDALIEPDETFTLVMGNVQNAVLATPEATGTILDDDNVPSVTVADGRALEPAGGTGTLLFRARLSRASAHDVLLDWQTANGSALAGLDYLAAAGTLTIPAGDLEGSIAVTLLADATVEADEQFLLELSNPSQATLARTTAIGTIVDPAFDPAVDPRQGPDENSVPALKQPSALAFSPDGRHLYAASDSGNGVLVFRRLDGDGQLEFVSFHAAATDAPSALLDGPDDLLVSPDGAFVYVAARRSDAIVSFARDPASGQLTWLANTADGAGGVGGVDGVVALAFSPDADYLYAAGRDGNAVAAFSRDPMTGTLGFLEAETAELLGAGAALQQPVALLVSPDGGQLYVASRNGNAVQTFARDAGSGLLDFSTVARNNLDGFTGLAGATAMVLGPDGQQLYVLSDGGSDHLAIFDRAPDGSLVQRSGQLWTSGGNAPGLDGPTALALSADGSELYATGFGDHSLSIFRRAEDGSLSLRQTLFDDQGGLDTMAGPSALAISPDDRNVYVAASLDNAIVVFLRQAFTGIFGDGFGDD